MRTLKRQWQTWHHNAINACILMLSFCLVCCGLPVAAVPDNKSQPPEHVVIPVYYLTDRNRIGNTFGPDRKYTVNCLHDMYYGVAYLPVDNVKSRLPDQVFDRLGWSGQGKVREQVCRKEMIEKSTPEEEKKSFFDLLSDALARSGSNHICLFLHGAADPFEDAVDDAAQMAYYLECPIILYSWPSVGKLRKYRVDEGNVEWSQAHYNTFLQDLQEFSQTHPLEVSLVAHSVGNRLLARSVWLMVQQTLYQDVSLVSPDIDAEIFKHYIMGYKGRGAKVRLYVSNRDKVLPFTQMLYGGYYRLGESVGSMLSMVSTPQRALFQPHRVLPKLSRSGVKTDFTVALQQQRMEKIDFTALDRRWIGHHFPFELVASMIRSGHPGAGLAFLSETMGRGNRFARFARWLNDLPPDDVTSYGMCKRVVRAELLKQEPADSLCREH